MPYEVIKMKRQSKKLYPILLTVSFASLLMFSGMPASAADKSMSCEQQSTYRTGAPGKGTVLRKQDCERHEFAAFERRSIEQQDMGFEDKNTMKTGKPTYNRRPINR